MRASSLALCALVGVYILAMGLLLLGEPDVSVDYVAQLNAPARAVAEEDRAWPIYREALLAGLRDPELVDAILLEDGPGRGSRLIRAGDPGWPETVAFLRDHEDLLDLIRTAAAKPGMGFIAVHQDDLHGDDRLALYGPEYDPQSAHEPANAGERLASESLGGVLLPQLTVLGRMTRLLITDSELAYAENDHAHVLMNLNAQLGVARHSRETPTLTNSLAAVSIVNLTLHQTADLLHRDPERWTREELTQLAHLLAGIDPLVQMEFSGERMMMQDMFQRIYSEEGYVTRDGLQFLLAIYPESAEQDRILITSTSGLPVANLVFASREEMERQFDRLMAMLEAEAAMPLWKRMRQSRWDDAISDLTAEPLGYIRYWPVLLMNPGTPATIHRTDQALALRDALLVAIAMELHRRDHSRYPGALADLSPRYLPSPPVDYSTGDPLRVAYSAEGGFVLYGLGRDGDDDGGAMSEQGRGHWPGMPDEGDWVLYPPVIKPAAQIDSADQ